ncbi:HAMP domain-containing sensor histidine kinase [Massilia sp. erpn]|uniref:sensor histidine kinase n=1 Tax=Massilia sp. erpn TaxID=2738142 RepID=UPI002104A8DF|nr:HAMP domain-containing sensor histidine kinase [Massilia sp. erpn]UTY60441.1 HAMP domain-containing histidine kinase [Massilia sp. erpn]
MKPAGSLRRRLMLAFALVALFTALCFSVFGLLFVYSVEDDFFANILKQETAHQQRSWSEHGVLAHPLRDTVRLLDGADQMPADLAVQLPAGPRSGEFFGQQGRHYHLRELRLAGRAAPLYLLAEVSGELVVRPRLPFILGFLGAAMLAIVAFTLLLGYWLAGRASAPLTRLAQLVSSAKPEQLPRHFADGFPDNEIGSLARALEDALARTAAFIEREQHFTRDASHELRTPLAVIGGAAYLLEQQPLAPQAAGQLARIRSAAGHMEQSLAALLALAREDETPAASASALLPSIEMAVVRFAHLLDGKPVQVAVEVDAAAQARCPVAVLDILLSNLVSNAFANTQQGEVRITFEENSLVVSDSGSGISVAVAERLYEAGVKGEGSQGLGLGLSIAHRLAQQHGIRLHVANANSSASGVRASLHFPA